MRTIDWEHFSEPEEIDDDRVVPIILNQPQNNQNFDIYIGHTNFRLHSVKDLEILNNIDGIEVLRILTRYRFMIAIGACFEFSQVATEIEMALGCFAKPEKNISTEIMGRIHREVDELSEKSDFWCIYVFPNGKFNLHSLDNLKDLEKQLILYNECKELSDGIVVWPKDIQIPETNETGEDGVEAQSEQG